MAGTAADADNARKNIRNTCVAKNTFAVRYLHQFIDKNGKTISGYTDRNIDTDTNGKSGITSRMTVRCMHASSLSPGEWKDIEPNVNIKPSVFADSYLMMYFDHGTVPKDETYGYVLIPNATADKTAAYAERPDVKKHEE